ncbi:MAG: hypothetical protein NTX72_02585 [Candidatus Uhrbacteria bacterium]|nr:hypothetical protein [Candidatus Uhrbacteria bacterium]
MKTGRVLKVFFSWAIALIILFEEWGWEPLQRLAGQFAKLPIFRHVERLILKLPPYPALILFLVPAIILFPIKLLAVHAMANGHPVLGLVVILSAKVLGTAIVARLFHLTQPALMQLEWFARWHVQWTGWKNRVVAYARDSTVWRTAHELKQRGIARWKMIKLLYFSHE